MPHTPNVRAIGYIRVSTEEQASEGVSLDQQTDALRSYASFRHFELVDIIEDAGVSAAKPLQTRPGGRELLGAVERGGIGVVVAYKLDRLFRDTIDCLAVTKRWDELGVDLHLVDLGGQPIDTSSAVGRFVLTIMAGVAEMERNLIRERTRASMAHMKKQGQRTGAISYGYQVGQDGQTLEPVPEQQRVIDLIRQLHAQDLSLRQIAQSLESQGILSRKGKPFHPQMLSRILAQHPPEKKPDSPL